MTSPLKKNQLGKHSLDKRENDVNAYCLNIQLVLPDQTTREDVRQKMYMNG